MKWVGFNVHGRRPGISLKLPRIEMRSWAGIENTYFISFIFTVISALRIYASLRVLQKSIKSMPVYMFAKQLHFRYRFQTQFYLYFFSKFLILVPSNHQPNTISTIKSTAAPPAIYILRIMSAGSSLPCTDSRAIHIRVVTNRRLKSKPKTHSIAFVSFAFSIFLLRWCFFIVLKYMRFFSDCAGNTVYGYQWSNYGEIRLLYRDFWLNS